MTPSSNAPRSRPRGRLRSQLDRSVLRRFVVTAAGVVAAGALAVPASAHEYWLAPSRYAAAAGQVVEVGALAGTGFRGERKPWSPARCVRFVARLGKRIDLSHAASPGDLAWARLAPTDAGGGMLAYESNFASIELPAPEFDAYLEAEGLTGPIEARRRANSRTTGRERYRRCAKTWLAGGDGTRATEPVGLPLEIVPLAGPGRDAVLRVRVLLDGRPLEGALVKAWRTPFAVGGVPTDGANRDSVRVAWQGRTDAGGEVSVPVAEVGEWLVSTVHMVPCPVPSEADWESTWASLTFARPLVKRERR